jgi:formate hydrogenlyase subunit 6/NADH:ubiquinone oxidoreductase subunit I
MESIGTMLSDVLGSLFRRPATESYPLEHTDVPSQLRGLLHLKMESCTGCGLCAMDCPANAIQVTMLDRKAKRFVVDYYIDRCAFCGQCMQSCRHGSISMSSAEWELAKLDRDHFLVHFGDPHDIEQVVAGTPTGGTAAIDHN